MRVRRTGVLTMGVIAVATTVAAAPLGTDAGASGTTPHDRRFDRIATFGVYTNNDDPSEQTVAEIADVSDDGMTLIYTDSPGERIGFVDIEDPADPAPLGTLAMAGEPTSVATVGAFALVGVNTSESFTDPSGRLAVVDVESRTVVAEIPLAGQPDSVSTSPDGRYAAIAIENERDEDVEVDGVEGGLPQGPAGVLQIVDLVGQPAAWQLRSVELAGLAGYGSDDPEPEYVDIDRANRAVVTLQENNHVVVVDLRSGRILSDFSAGTVDLEGIDATEDGIISFTDTLVGVPREPDAVTWIDGNRFATANEGDLFGGSRGFTVFRRDGAVLYDSGASLEHLAATHGHYPEDRSENKGAEPEGITSARFGADDFLFVGSERGSFVAVYRVTGAAAPQFVQLLPTGLGPEGLLAIPERDLFVVTSEEDDPTLGVRATITIFGLGDGPAAYPRSSPTTPAARRSAGPPCRGSRPISTIPPPRTPCGTRTTPRAACSRSTSRPNRHGSPLR